VDRKLLAALLVLGIAWAVHTLIVRPSEAPVGQRAEAPQKDSFPVEDQPAPAVEPPLPPPAVEPEPAAAVMPAAGVTPTAVQSQIPAPDRQAPTQKTKAVGKSGESGGAKEKPIERIALAFVGTDALAELVWLDAINDPSVSARDRSDLIEDLNEEGFPDPRRPTSDDLPMILNRLAIIEDNALFAMDDVNAAAFAEAYKDLVNMYAKVMNQ